MNNEPSNDDIIRALSDQNVLWDWEDPSQPPKPLLQEHGDRGSVINYREGGRIELRNRTTYSPKLLFMIALGGSAGLGGQPLRCSGFAPGVMSAAVREL